MSQSQLPLFSQLINHINKNPISFHVPGHKNGDIFPTVAKSLFSPLLKIDLTELRELDDLYDPNGAIRDAQCLAARLYGVDTTYFLVNGSTVGNLASILSIAGQDDTVIVQRDCHKSVLNALKLANARPVFISPDYDLNAQVAIGIDQEAIKQVIQKYPSAKGIILTNPNYYGISRNLKAIIDYAHSFEIPVIVDEAHGAHFILGSPFPESAVKAGADLVIQSAHKTLPAMTMGSYLHVQGRLVNMKTLEFYLQALQSSSPSYPIMASLDLARFYLAMLKEKGTHELAKKLQEFTNELSKIEQLKLIFPSASSIETDPLKIMIKSNHPDIKSGYALQKQLEKFQIFSELADNFRVLLILPLGEELLSETSIQLIQTALQKNKIEKESNDNETVVPFYFKDCELALTYQEMKILKKSFVSFENALGKVAAAPVIPYPPGIPILVEGECITKEHISYLIHLQLVKAKIQGGQAILSGQLEVFS